MFGWAPIYDVLTTYKRSFYTIRRKYPEWAKIVENLVGYARILDLKHCITTGI